MESNRIILADGTVVPYGILVWATGLAPNKLINSLQVPKDKLGRVYTNGHLQIMSSDATSFHQNVYSLGDCATIKDYDLPCTAQVANQKAKYLTAS